jgi:hypothetical protein
VFLIQVSALELFVVSTQEGAGHGQEVEDEGFLKDLVVIFIFLGMLCTVCCLF